jgi:hypothetical protein
MSHLAQRLQTLLSRVRPFYLGRWYLSDGARAAHLPGDFVLECFRRHAKCDFGAVSQEHYDDNLDAIAEGSQVFSVYQHGDIKLYLITEADRSRTTLLLAEEY